MGVIEVDVAVVVEAYGYQGEAVWLLNHAESLMLSWLLLLKVKTI